jgi:alkylresorcinol/alkylpyrone synthase
VAFIVKTATGFPPHYYTQEELIAKVREAWVTRNINLDRLERIYRNVTVDGRYTALPIEAYLDLSGFRASNDAWIEVALKLGEETLLTLLEQARLDPKEVSQLTFTTVTGIAVPSIEARLMNRIAFSPHLKRVPLFGLGCLGGAAGVARVADYLKGHPDEAAILLSIELTSLTMQVEDISMANIIASALFGDGAAAVLMVGRDHHLTQPGQPQVLASQSIFFPESEEVMGWEVLDTGFKIILNSQVPEFARNRLRPGIEAFLAAHNLSLDDISHWIAHPGGPKVIEALEAGLSLKNGALQLSRKCLSEVGNLSSTSILWILKETLVTARPSAGAYGLMIAMGPAFSAEIVLLQW